MRVGALIAILGLNPRKTRATGGHSDTNLANPRLAMVSDADLQEAAKKLAAVTSGDNLVTVATARP
jgi:hypothetical protein